MLEQFAPNVWAAAAPQSFLRLRVGTRMTVLRFANGDLLLHSPVPLGGGLAEAVEALGTVRHIVCPNMFHHLYAGEAQARWPQARLHGPAALQRKRRDLRFDAVLSDTPDPDWQGEIEPVSIAGSLLQETVLYHRPSRTLVSADLVENWRSHPHWLTREYLRLNGALGQATWPRLLRLVYTRRPAARDSLARIYALPIERILLAHGEPITADASVILRQAFAWL
ncbi:DUF4336 domain-containing protein [Pseudoduganella sp. OTU4001]|uniref:DUF4336 domain-containing protein n=1 Tax=Pseudoduganella sp. OTU4001 TaxID=3043854 RepID=UPI00313D7172